MEFGWRETMSLGLEALDEQHKGQIDLIRRFVNLPTDDLWRGDAVKLLTELRARSALHFSQEERVMAAIAYRKRDDHAVQHQRLLAMLDDIIIQVDSEGSPFPFAMVKGKADELLQFWFFDHFLKSDLPLKPHISRRLVRP